MSRESSNDQEGAQILNAPRRLRGKNPSYTAAKYDFSKLADCSPIDVAVEYVEHNWYLVPVEQRKGEAVIDDDVEPTRNLDQIREWVQEHGFSIAVATGRASHIVALACRGNVGKQSLMALLADRDPFVTLEGREKETSFFLFRSPNEYVQSRVDVVPGVDFVGEGGYLVPLPAAWGTHSEISILPDWVLPLVTGAVSFGLDKLVAAVGLTALQHGTSYDAAKVYESLGWMLSPIKSDGTLYKAPEEQCTPQLWIDRPELGLGIETGVASGIVGLWSSDPELLAFLDQKYGLLHFPHFTGRETVFCFRAPQHKFPSKELRRGLEYVGENDFLVAPPSTIEGQKLRWAAGTEFLSELPEIPQWLCDVISGQKNLEVLIQATQEASRSKQKSKGKGTGQSPQLGAAALSYAENQKWLVHPIRSGCKKPPLTKNGLKDATRDQAQISKWWARWPKANIAVRTGAESGIVVLDVDVSNGQPGLRSLFDLERQHGKLETLRARTPSGGIHLFFLAPAQAVRNTVKFLPGLDTRGDDGYVLVHPSRVGGSEYRWENSLPIAEMPDWLLTLINTAQRKGKASSRSPQERLTYTNALRGVQEGARNDTVFRFALKLRQEEWLYDEALVLIRTAAGNCTPPLEEEEAIRCLEQAWGYSTPAALSDMGNAERFVEVFGGSVRYVQEKESWLTWTGHYWKKNQHAVYRMARTTIKMLRDEAMAEADEERRNALFAHCRKSESQKALERMLDIAGAELSVSAEDLDRGNLIGFTNGVFDPTKKTFRPGRREDLVTKHVSMLYDSANPACLELVQQGRSTPAASTATAVSSAIWRERFENWLTARCKIGTGLSAKSKDLREDFSASIGEKVTERRFGDLMSDRFSKWKSDVYWYGGLQLDKKKKK